MKSKPIIMNLALLVLALILAGCSSSTPQPTETQVPCPTPAPCPTCPTPPTPEPCPEPIVKDVPFEIQWVGSAHADNEAEAFRHWDDLDPKEIPTSCAKCHSTTGFEDFTGADGSAAGVVDAAAPVDGGIQCVGCHNAATATMSSVIFPSGVEVSGLDASARCMQCHQGRASLNSVNEAIEKLGLTEDVDTASADLGFVNIHYFAAAATLYGTQTKGGYEYPGQAYDYKNDHVAGYDSCIGCHNPHTLEVKIDECSICHTNLQSKEDLSNIRMNGSKVDYDGDGNVDEGIAMEIQGLQEMLLTAIQAYASEVAGTPTAYNVNAYPYFFVDTNADGVADDAESVSANGYKAFTARMLKAAYNYQTSIKDPGQFAHGGKYIIELLYDSIADLNTALSNPVDLSTAHRIDAGHFAGSEEAFRHWDAQGEVPASCARCHSSAGLPTYLKDGVNISVPTANGMSCTNCHNDLTTFTRYEVGAVVFPSGAKLDLGISDANLCINCHQGRESKSSLDKAISSTGVGDDVVSDKLSFRNPHYFAAGATLFGTEAKGAYEYDGQQYNGRFMHIGAFSTCVNCHDSHALSVKVETCNNCHSDVKTQEDLQTIRKIEDNPVDYDGDGDASEGIAGEVSTMADVLYAAIQEYAANQAGTAIIYEPASYPYYFADANGNGAVDEGEGSYPSWTPRLLRAAYNYQWVNKDPGAFAHNGAYIMQILFDSIKDVGGSTDGMTRPVPPAAP